MREDTDSLVKSSASDAFREATAKGKGDGQGLD